MPKHGFQLCNEWEASRHPQNAIAEQKYDGIHLIAEGGRLYNRKGRDITEQFPEVQVHPSLVLVGELVVLDHGISDFNKLLLRKTDNRKEILLRSLAWPATFIAFDILEFKGNDLTGMPLRERRRILENVEAVGLVSRNVHVPGYWVCPVEKVPEYLQLMREQQGEGIIVKNLDAPYQARRWDAWMKVKAWEEDEFFITRYEITPAGGFVVYIPTKGGEQRVVVNSRQLAGQVAEGKVQKLRIRYLEIEPSGLLRQPHVHGVAWAK